MLPGAEKRKTGGQSIYLQTLGIVVDMNSLIITTTFMQSSVVHGWLMWVADSMYHGCTNFLEEQATVSITNELLHSKLITSCVWTEAGRLNIYSSDNLVFIPLG